jgi:apolipoprotein D and lipocalin family protein
MLGVLGSTLLGACLAAPVPQNDPSLLRNPTVPLSIISRGGADAMQGEWKVRASSPGYRDIQSLTFNTHATPQHLIGFRSLSCDGGGACEALNDGWLAKPIAQNRWRLTSETTDIEMELWIIWIDDELRTAAVGSPDSDLAFILDRKASGGADRIKAASEVLDFNGYNMSAFVTP